jgi:thiamine pyrophosphokinase
MTALLLCNGEPPPRKLAHRLACQSDIIVAADGGANSARALGLTPAVIIGDLDSLTRTTRRAFPGAEIIRLLRQDNTDLEKALDEIHRRGFDRVIVLGATGRRIDFTLGNFSIVWRYQGRLHVLFAGDGWYAVPVGRERRIHAPTGTTVSLIPFGPCSGITLRGLVYPLHNARMAVGDIGVSNVVRRSPFSVSVRRGRMLLVVMESFTPGRL